MARSRRGDRFHEIQDAALRVFAHRGLRRARMADVAREMRVSPGTLYNYFESKEALFHSIVERGAAAAPPSAPRVLPVPTPAPGDTERRLREQLAASLRLRSLEAALARQRVADPRAELEAILDEFWELVARTRATIGVLERSALDLPEIYEVWFSGARRTFFAKLARYVKRRAGSGHFRPTADPAIAARCLAETVVYFARHRHGDADPALLPDDDAIRKVVVPMLVASLVPD